MEDLSERDKLAARVQSMVAEGLLDLKFFVRNTSDASVEEVCREVNRMYDAVDQGKAEPLDFRDGNP